MSAPPATTTAPPAPPAQQAAPTVATAIPGYDKMSFEQRRLAQDQNAARKNAR